MGYYEDHLFSVSERWKNKYIESGRAFPDFCEYMEKILTRYGWSIEEIQRIEEYIKKAVPK